MQMIVIHGMVKVYTYIIYAADSDLLKGVCESGLVYLTLEWVETQLQCLILLGDETPKVQNFRKGILLETSEADCLLKDWVCALEKLLAQVRI